MKNISRLYFLLITTIILSGCSTQFSTIFPGGSGGLFRRPVRGEDIRVAIKTNIKSVKVKVEGSGVVYNALNNKRISTFKNMAGVMIGIKSDGNLSVNNKSMRTSRIMIKPDVEGSLWVEGVCYRGDLTIIANSAHSMTLVNTLELEKYLMGVLPKETWASWHPSALKVQAVAARTFAIHHCLYNAKKDYDIKAPGHQLYGGKSAEAISTTKAIYDTDGQYLEYRGDVLCTFFYTTCGGHTEEAVNIFPDIQDYPKSVECNHCEPSPHYSWKYIVGLDKCAADLRKNGQNLNGKIKKVEILSRFKSGRIKKIKFSSSRHDIVLTGEECRRMLGYNNVRSTQFKIRIKNDKLEFNGNGWGHGVGMCQWGSKALAEDGMSYQDILSFYYPKSKLKKSR